MSQSVNIQNIGLKLYNAKLSVSKIKIFYHILRIHAQRSKEFQSKEVHEIP